MLFKRPSTLLLLQWPKETKTLVPFSLSEVGASSPRRRQVHHSHRWEGSCSERKPVGCTWHHGLAGQRRGHLSGPPAPLPSPASSVSPPPCPLSLSCGEFPARLAPCGGHSPSAPIAEPDGHGQEHLPRNLPRGPQALGRCPALLDEVLTERKHRTTELSESSLPLPATVPNIFHTGRL